MKKEESEKEIFGRYVSLHTVISYESAIGLYEFSKVLKLTKEDIVKYYGTLEHLSALNTTKVIWERDNQIEKGYESDE